MERPRRRDAGVDRAARRQHHQGASRIRPHLRRRREMTPALIQSQSDRTTPRGAGSEPALIEIVKSAEVVALRTPAAEDQSEEPPLYQSRRKIYPQRVHGTFRRIKWVVLFVTLGIYYGCAIPALGSWHLRATSSRARRLAEQPFLFLLY